MVDPNTRQGKRTPVTLKIKFKSETLEQFIERYAVDVSQGGIFIRTKEPLAVGTQMRFEFQLRDASPLIAGEGTVVWTRENDPSRPAIAPGMGVRFDRLAEGSQTVLERILAEKAKQAPQRSPESTKPPLFTDTPTKVAPLPVQEALLGDKNELTPLPKPMPFHSDAEDFDEQAFEEATKVRALDELIAQTAEGGEASTQVIPPDELAARRIAAGGRADSTLADPPTTAPPGSGPIGVAKHQVDRDSAPGLPSPPPAGAQPRLLDTTPSPRSVEVPPPEMGRTKLGFEAPRSGGVSTPPQNKSATPPAPAPVVPAKRASSPAIKDAVTRPSGAQAVATEATGPSKRPMAPQQKSSAGPIVILLLVLLAAGGAGVWFFYLRPKAEQAANNDQPKPGSGSAVVKHPGSAGSSDVVEANGSNGSAQTMEGSNGSAGSAGSAAVEPPKGPLVDTTIASSVDKATVEVVDTDQKGPAPFTAKLEKDKPYKVRISAPTFATTEMDVKGGQDKVTAKLVAKPRIVSVSTEPAGALIFVDNAATGSTTPHDVELTKQQAAKKSVTIMIKKSGYKSVVKTVALDAYQENDSQMVAKLEERLAVQVQINRPPPDRGSGGTPPPGTGSGSTGSAATPPDTTSGSGSTTPPPPTNGSGSTTPPPGTGSAPKPLMPPGTGSATTPGAGSAAKPPAATGGSSASKPAEPEPDFVKK